VQDKELHARLQKMRRSVPSDEPLQHVFRARHAALLASRRAEEARQSDAAWIEACPAYAEARRAILMVAAGAIGSVVLMVLIEKVF